MAESPRKSKQQKPVFAFDIPEGTVPEGGLKFGPKETAQERKHRHQTDNRTFWVKEAPAYLVALLIILATATYCFWTLIRTNPPLDEKKFVMSILTSLVVGIMGYLFGKVTK